MNVTALATVDATEMAELLGRLGLVLKRLPPGADIPGSYWGAPEAGIIRNAIYARPDTPAHSVLHTASHFICMDDARRAALHTDCGGDDLEESAVCYLQSLLADAVPGYGRARLWADMDAWGYSFRLGSARAWFEQDAAAARAWLFERGLIDETGRVLRRGAPR